jgi:hypothetical protein
MIMGLLKSTSLTSLEMRIILREDVPPPPPPTRHSVDTWTGQDADLAAAAALAPSGRSAGRHHNT